MSEEASIRAAVRAMQTNARQLLARADDVLALLDQLEIPDSPGMRCPRCEIRVKGPRTLAEHLYVSHGGPEPEHWTDAYLAEQAKKARKQAKEAA